MEPATRNWFSISHGLLRCCPELLPECERRVINEDFNAAFGRVGWRQREVLYMGLPLWAILENEERVALIAHELAHGVNGDPVRGFFVGSAAAALARWYTLFRPDRIWDESKGIAGLPAVPFNIAMLMLANLAWIAAVALSHLLWRDSQRAEYLADRLAASISGTGPSRSLLRKLHYGETFALAIHRAVVSQGARSDILDNLRELGLKAPPREVERVTRVQQLEGSRLDATHPPSAYRIELLRAHYVAHPKVEFPPPEFEAVEKELLPFRNSVQLKLEDKYRAGLYS
ncbi:MAG TPA: M48 family metallopeptidase [Candidatus Methylomirabilis sp.]|nr:M48 family metallopeptidase [Candidatus Methylomirabilis sp.]